MFKNNAVAIAVIVLLLAIFGLQIYRTFWHKPAPQPMKVVMVPRRVREGFDDDAQPMDIDNWFGSGWI